MDWHNKVVLAKQFIRRTSTAWVPKQTSHELSTDEAARNAIAEALYMAKKHEALDPGFTELRKRFFAGISNQMSRSQDGESIKSAPLPCRPGSGSTLATRQPPQSSPNPAQQFAGYSTAKTCQQSFPSRPVSPVGTSRFESPPTPSPRFDDITSKHAFDGLGIQMAPPDPEKRDIALDGCGPYSVPVPPSSGQSLESQRNAFSSAETSNSCSPQQSSQCLGSRNSPASSTSVITGTQSHEHLQSTAAATLANARIFKVDRDSKIPDHFVPKKTPQFYQTIDAARELAEARMGIPSGPLPSPPLPRNDFGLGIPPTPIKKIKSAPLERNVFKRATRNPTLRAMVSSLSMRSPEATEMISSPLSPTANHPAFRTSPDTPATPITTSQRLTFAQKYAKKHDSTSTKSDERVVTPVSKAVSRSSSTKSSIASTTGEDRWTQRVRQRAKVERDWKVHGVLNAPVEQPPLPVAAPCQTCPGPSGLLQQSLLETPTSSKPFPTHLTAALSSSPALHSKISPRLSRKTQDSPTPLNIKKFSPTPKLKLGLSLPDSPSPLQVSKFRSQPAAVRRVVEQNLKALPFSFEVGKDPFAKCGSSSKGEEGWPLSDTSSSRNAGVEHPKPYERSPLDGQIDTIIGAWRHASATQEPLTSASHPLDNADISGKYQYIRNFLELDQLCAPAAGKAHPNHPYHWQSMSVMCKGLHDNARTSSDSSVIGDDGDGVRLCSFCQETCCYFGQQLGRAALQTKGRDQALEELKNQARSHVYFLSGTCPKGIEDYQVLVECGLCDRVCCPSCANICQYPMCGQPVCKECVELEDGICGDHH